MSNDDRLAEQRAKQWASTLQGKDRRLYSSLQKIGFSPAAARVVLLSAEEPAKKGTSKSEVAASTSEADRQPTDYPTSWLPELNRGRGRTSSDM